MRAFFLGGRANLVRLAEFTSDRGFDIRKRQYSRAGVGEKFGYTLDL